MYICVDGSLRSFVLFCFKESSVEPPISKFTTYQRISYLLTLILAKHNNITSWKTDKIKKEPSVPSDILFFQWAGNNLKRDCLIDPSNPQEWAYHFKETVFGTQRQGGAREKNKTKTWWKTEEGEKITSDDGIWNCLVPTWLIILRISLCGRSFWRWLFVSHCDWNNNDCSLVFLLFAERKRQKNMLFSSTGANSERSLLLQGVRGTLDLRPSFVWLYRLCWVFPR